MEEIKIEKLQSGEIPEVENSGLVCFYDETDQLLYCRMSSNISSFLSNTFERDIEDNNLGELISKTKSVNYTLTENIFEALILEKGMIAENQPAFNRIYRDYDNYIYLGLNFIKYPFIKIENNTVHDYFFLGPFRDYYLLRDSIDILSRVFGTPVCAAREMPCYLLETGQCKGYCVQNKEELARDLTACYLLPDQSILAEIEIRKQEFSKNLKFREAEELSNYYRILQRFYAQLTFLSVTKWLNLEFEYKDQVYVIKNGLLKQAGSYSFPVLSTEYQPNELYAIEKSELDERWVIFNHIKNTFPQELITGYEKTRELLTKYLTNKDK